MATEITLPQLGERTESGVVLAIRVSEGEHVDKDQTILELETDKATTDVPAPQAGVVKEIFVSAGDEVKSGDKLMAFEAEGEAEKDNEKKEEEEKGDGEKAEVEERQREGEKGDGEEGKKGEREEGEGEEEGQKAEVEPAEEAEETGEAPQRAASGERRAPRPGAPIEAAPDVRQLARELGVDVADVAPAGDRVTQGDVKSHVRDLVERLRDRVDLDRPELPDFSEYGEVRREAMSPVRRRIAQNVARSWKQVPHVTQFDRADVTALESFRSEFADRAEQAGGKLTVTAILLKITALALREFPRFNASIDIDAGEVILKEYVHVGIAVDTDDGLLVPVVRDADQKGLIELAVELTQAAQKARDGELSADAMRGGSFSITNLGGMGTTNFTPIVGWPQVAILSVGRARTEAVWQQDEDRFVPRQILPLGITYDHRAVDGADAARFLRWIAQVLENPLRLTVEP